MRDLIRPLFETRDAMKSRSLFTTTFIAVFFASLIGGPILLIPFFGAIIDVIFVFPFFIGGLLGVASQNIEEEIGIRDFWRHAKENYKNLVGAFAIMQTSYLLFMAVVIIISTFVGAYLIGLTTPSISFITAFGRGFPLVFFMVFPVLFLSGLFLQFVDATIVFGGQTALSSYKESWLLLKNNLSSSIWYTGVRSFFTMLFIMSPIAVVTILTSLAQSQLLLYIFILPAVLFGLTVGAMFFTTFHVTYYRHRQHLID